MIRAVLFDLEGTLLQNEALEALTFAYAVTELRPGLDESEVARSCMALGDRPRPEIADELLRRFDLERAARERAREIGAWTPRQVLVDLKLRAYDGALSDPATVLSHSYPRNVALARRLHHGGRRTALYTRLRWWQARSTLAALGTSDAFDFVATAEDVDRGKPDPETNLLAARELDVPPEECLAIEGFPAGVEAALAAGMPVVAFTTPLTRQRFGDADLLYRCWAVEDSHALCSVVNRMDKSVHDATRG